MNLERHHIVPRKFGGSDRSENLVTLCPTCHQAIEKLYNKRFYENLGAYHTVVDYDDDQIDPVIQNVQNIIEFVIREYKSSAGHLAPQGKRTILVVLDEFGMTGQFCFSCERFFNTRFEHDDHCPQCKGLGFHREVQT